MICCAIAFTVALLADLSTLMPGAGVVVTVAVDGFEVIAAPVGGVPVAVAEFCTEPASKYPAP